MKIFFEVETKFGKYTDTLILSDDRTYSDEEIATLKQTRVDKWVEYMTNPPFVSGPTPEELALQTVEVAPDDNVDSGNIIVGTD